MKKLRNLAFVDAQNLTQNMRNAKKPWKLDLIKFRTFLKDKYQVDKAYYFIGINDPKNENLYKFLKHAGYEVIFREHDPRSKGAKKTVSCLIKDRKFRAIMFPSRNSSSLYRKIGDKYIVKLYSHDIKSILELKK